MKKILFQLGFLISYFVTKWDTRFGIVDKDKKGVFFLRYEALSIMLIPVEAKEQGEKEVEPKVLEHILYHFAFNRTLLGVTVKKSGPQKAFFNYDLLRGFVEDANMSPVDVNYFIHLKKLTPKGLTNRYYNAYLI